MLFRNPSFSGVHQRLVVLVLGLLFAASPRPAAAQSASAPVVRVVTSAGSFDIQLLPGVAPQTVNNFLKYVDRPSNGYTGTFIHRSVPNFVIQGGGYITSTFHDTGTSVTATHIPLDPPVANEFSVSNTRGTVAMAKQANNPNSATSEWFVNLKDNSADLDTTNGGFTVFGQVVSGMSVVDAIAALPRLRSTGEGIPVRNFTAGQPATPPNLVNLAMVRLTGPRADFNSDAKTDVLWQNTSTGRAAIWLMNGTAMSSSVALPPVQPEWRLSGSGDFNFDGKSDLIWQNSSTGQCVLWLMNGAVRTSGVTIGTAPTSWRVVGSGDFNADGKPDIVWQNSETGQRSAWLMNGTVHSGNLSFGTVAPVWKIAAVGDFNRDARPDLVWENSSSGQRVIWFMNRATRIGTANLPTVATDWQIAGAGDFNADRQTDLVWQNATSGKRAVWLMSGASMVSSVSLPTVAPEWSIRNR